MIDYTKYKWFVTSQKTMVVGGKSANQNDELLKTVLASEQEYYVLHTSDPGSPFSVILRDISKVKREELLECATFTACFSRAWKERKKRVSVDIFKTSQLSKEPNMKAGMWRVTGRVEKVPVTLELGLVKQKGTLRAVPLATNMKPLMTVIPGTIDKESMAAQLGVELGDSFTRSEIVAALPAGGVRKKT